MDASLYPSQKPWRARMAVLAPFIVSICMGWTPALADGRPLPPQTKIRLSIIQWISTKGVYEKWEALGGEFEISDDGSLTLPIVGTLPVGNLDADGLSTEIATRLKAKIGLVETPEATVSVIEYPPVFVVGAVKTPGEYKFQAGLTVLKALAMSGGELRAGDGTASAQTDLVGLLRGCEIAILRGEIKIARLQAEMSDAKEVTFDLQNVQDKDAATAILRQEKAIFAARANLLERQSKSFGELRDLLSAEIVNLEKKSGGADADITSVEKELRIVKSMIEKGIATPAKQTELERLLRSYYAGRLDLSTAVMRARQGISETSRNLVGLFDNHHTEVATELQNEQASLDQLKLKRDTAQKQLLDTLSKGGSAEAAGSPDALRFTVNRRENGAIVDLPVTENTLLQPGDVVRVERKASHDQDESRNVTAAPDTGNAQAGQVSQ